MKQNYSDMPNGIFQPPQDGPLRMRIPEELIPKCPEQIGEQSICIQGDAEDVFGELAAPKERRS